MKQNARRNIMKPQEHITVVHVQKYLTIRATFYNMKKHVGNIVKLQRQLKRRIKRTIINLHLVHSLSLNTNLNEEKIITDKLKQTKSKIADRQYQILKLEKQIHASKKENNSNGNYLRKQIIDLEDQICKYKSLIQDLSDKKNELNAQKTTIRHTLQLLCNEPSTDESDISVTRMLPNTNITINQQTAQNPTKRVASDLIEQTSDLPENHTEVNMDISAKKT